MTLVLTDKLRKQALDKATSPEQLDAMLTVAAPKGAWGVGVLATALVAALVWSAFSSAPVKVTAQGILLTGGEVFGVSSDADGRAGHPKVHVGSEVAQNDVLIELELFPLQAEIEAAEAVLTNLKRTVDLITRQNAIAAEAAEKQFAQETLNYQQLIERTEVRLLRLEAELKDRRQLFSKGLVTTSNIERLETRLEDAIERLATTKVDNLSIAQRQIKEEDERDVAMRQAKENLAAQEQLIAQLLAQREQGKFVRATEAGEIVATLVSFSDQVTNGQLLFEIVQLENTDQGQNTLQAVLYIPAADAAKLKVGNPAQVVPSSARLERDGYVMGVVENVAPIPATQASIINRLRNPEFVNEMLKDGPVVEVIVALERNPQTASGFRWSSARGDLLGLRSGTTTVSHIVVGRKRILSFVIPHIERYLPDLPATPNLAFRTQG